MPIRALLLLAALNLTVSAPSRAYTLSYVDHQVSGTLTLAGGPVPAGLEVLIDGASGWLNFPEGVASLDYSFGWRVQHPSLWEPGDTTCFDVCQYQGSFYRLRANAYTSALQKNPFEAGDLLLAWPGPPYPVEIHHWFRTSATVSMVSGNYVWNAPWTDTGFTDEDPPSANTDAWETASYVMPKREITVSARNLRGIEKVTTAQTQLLTSSLTDTAFPGVDFTLYRGPHLPDDLAIEALEFVAGDTTAPGAWSRQVPVRCDVPGATLAFTATPGFPFMLRDTNGDEVDQLSGSVTCGTDTLLTLTLWAFAASLPESLIEPTLDIVGDEERFYYVNNYITEELNAVTFATVNLLPAPVNELVSGPLAFGCTDAVDSRAYTFDVAADQLAVVRFAHWQAVGGTAPSFLLYAPEASLQHASYWSGAQGMVSHVGPAARFALPGEGTVYDLALRVNGVYGPGRYEIEFGCTGVYDQFDSFDLGVDIAYVGDDGYEQNDDFTQHVAVVPGTPAQDLRYLDADRYEFAALAGERLQVVLEVQGNDPAPWDRLYLHPPSRPWAYSVFDRCPGLWNEQQVAVCMTAPESGTYTVEFDGFWWWDVDWPRYALTVTVLPAPDEPEPDRDGDGFPDAVDALPDDPGDHLDFDGDTIGDNADLDDDNDGVDDVDDAFPYDPSESVDRDADGIGDNADPDDDNDGIPDERDNDGDNDGVPDIDDAFPGDPHESSDLDQDGIGDNADDDDDGDGIEDYLDNCPRVANPGQEPGSDPWVGLACTFDLDIDGNGSTDALTDGLLVLRYLFGFRGAALLDGAVAGDADPQRDIETHLAGSSDGLDIDGNTASDALTDGLLVLRYLFGFREAALLDGAVADDAEPGRDIETHLQGLVP